VTGFCWLVAFALGCFAAQEPAPVELDIPVHAAGYGVSFFEETARQFEALRPGVKVNIYGDPRIGDRVRIRAIGGNYPDATTAELLWPQLIASGHVLDLTPYLDGPNWEGDARWGDTFLPGVLESWRLGGRVYGLPFAHSCWTIFYNKKRFRELGLGEPRTWDEFFATCRKLRASGIAPLALPGVYMRYGDTFLRSAHYNLVGLDGWRAYNALEAGARTDPRFIRAAALIQEIATQHLITGWEGLTHTGAQALQHILAAKPLQALHDLVGQETLAIGQHGVDGAALWNSYDEMNVVGHDRVAEEPIAQAVGDVHPIVHSVIGIGHLDQRDPLVASEGAEVHGMVLLTIATH